MRGAELHGVLPLELQRVDRDDIARARERRALDRVDPDAADPVDHGRVAGPHAARVHRGSPPGRHPAADQRHRLQRKVVVDLDAGVLGYHRPLRERAEQAHLAQVLAVGVEPERPVRQAVVHEQRAHVTQVGHAAGAEPAVPAGRQERADHVVAGLEPDHPGADLLDDPGALVPAHDRVADRDVAGAQVVIGVAQARRHEPDQHLALLGRVELQLDDLPVLAHVPEHRCPGLHRTLLRHVRLPSSAAATPAVHVSGPKRKRSNSFIRTDRRACYRNTLSSMSSARARHSMTSRTCRSS